MRPHLLLELLQGPTEIRTRVMRVKTACDNHLHYWTKIQLDQVGVNFSKEIPIQACRDRTSDYSMFVTTTVECSSN